MRRLRISNLFAAGIVVALALLVGCSGGNDPAVASTTTTGGKGGNPSTQSVTGHEPVLSLNFTTISRAALTTTLLVHAWAVDPNGTATKYPKNATFTYWIAPVPIAAVALTASTTGSTSGPTNGSTTGANPVAVAGAVSGFNLPYPGIIANPTPVVLAADAGILPDASGTSYPTTTQNPSVQDFSFSASPLIAKGAYCVYGTVTVGTTVTWIGPAQFVVTD